MITFQKQHYDEMSHIYDVVFVAKVSSHPNVTENAAAFAMIQVQPYRKDYENHPHKQLKEEQQIKKKKKSRKFLLAK